MRWASLALLGLLAPAACAHAPKGPASTAPMLAWMERGECLDRCPVYRVVVYLDGVVEYDGRENVKAMGRRVGHIDAAAMQELRQAFGYAEWSTLTDYTHIDCYDLPTATLSYDGKTIEHDWGDTSAPDDLEILEARVDQLTGIADWIGPPQGPIVWMCN